VLKEMEGIKLRENEMKRAAEVEIKAAKLER